MTNKCKNCGTVVSDTAKFCTECGTKIERELKCANCGAVLAENAKFCMECGTKVGTVENITPVKESVEETVKPMIVQDGDHYTTLDQIPKGLDLSKYIITVEYVMRNEPSIIAKIAEKVNKYNGKVSKMGYSVIELDASSFTLKGQYVPKSIEIEANDEVEAFVKGFKEGWDDAGVQNDFMAICKLCESISIKPLMELDEITDGETCPTNFRIIAPVQTDNSPLLYVNEVLPFSDILHKTSNGKDVADSKFGVVYTLPNGSNVVAKILEKVEKYNKRATKHGYPLFAFNQDTMELKGNYEPKEKTPGMNYFKELMLAGQNGDLCGDFLKICKLCETVMIR